MTTEVHRDDRHRILHLPAPPDSSGRRLLVTFEHGRDDMAGFTPPRFPAYATRLGMAILSVQTARRDWYISPRTQYLVDALRDLTADHDEVFVTGFSMGGYAALAFSAACHATRLMVVSPQYSIDPKVAPFDHPRHVKFRRIGLEMPLPHQIGDINVPGGIIYDPTITVDRAHAYLALQHFHRLEAVPLPYGGHPATSPMQDHGSVGTMASSFAQGLANASVVREMHRAARRKSTRYRLNIALAASQRHGARAAPELVKLAQGSWISPSVRLKAALRLTHMRHPRAEHLLSRLLDDCPDAPPAWVERIHRAIGEA